MGRKLSPYHDLKGESRRANRRKEAVLQVREGKTVAETARRHAVSRQTLYTWLERSQNGSAEVPLKPHGRPPLLSPSQREQLPRLLKNPPSHYGFVGRRWTLEKTRELILREFNVEFSSLSSISMLLKNLSLRLKG